MPSFTPHALALLAISSLTLYAQQIFPLKDVRPGLHGVGRTVFHGNTIDEFQVEILGLLENLTPNQTIVLARLSGGPLAETGILQGMSGSPVYIDGKLLGAVALGFPFSKEPIAGIQPIENMLADAQFSVPPTTLALARNARPSSRSPSNQPNVGGLAEISTPVALSGFTPRTLETFAAQFRSLGFTPQQGVGSGAPSSPAYTGSVVPGSMISVELLTGDMVISADGTVTYIDGKRIYAFGHRFLDTGVTDIPFARADVITLLPAVNTSFKLSAAREWVGSMLSDRATAIAGEIGRPAHMVPISISVHSPGTTPHNYRLQVVNDRFLTPFITQTAVFSTIDRTERTLGAGSLRLRAHMEFENGLPPLETDDAFMADNGVAQQAAGDAVVPLAFVLSAGFANLHLKNMSFDLEPVDAKRQLHIAQVWTSAHEVHPGDSVQITVLLQGENGFELTRSTQYRIPIGAPAGPINFSVSDALTLNAPDFAGFSQSQARSPEQLIHLINGFRGSEGAYLRIWRQQPSFTIAGPLPGGELTDPPPSVTLVLADPSDSAGSNAALTLTRGSQIAETKLPIDGYIVTGAKTVQIEVKD